MSTPAIDYEALAAQARATAPKVDYSALAAKARQGIEEPAPAEEKSGFVSQLGDFGSHAWEMLKGGAQGLMHPIDSVSSMLRNAADNLEEAKKHYKAGDTGAAIGSLKNAVPVLGPIAKQMRESGEKGDIGAEMGDLAGFMAAGKVGKLLPKGIKAAVEAAPGVAEAAPRLGTAVADAARAGGKDVASGAAKVGTGIALGHLGIPGEVAGATLATPGAVQIGSGMLKGYRALKQSLADSKVQEPPMGELVEMPKPGAAQGESVNRGTVTPIRPTPLIEMPGDAKPVIDVEAAIDKKGSFEYQKTKEAATKLAGYLRIGQIPVEDVAAMTPEQWTLAAKGAGVDVPKPSVAKVAVAELEKLYKSEHGPKIDQAVAEGNPQKANFYVQKAASAGGPKNPKAAEIARQLAEEMAK